MTLNGITISAVAELLVHQTKITLETQTLTSTGQDHALLDRPTQQKIFKVTKF